MRVTVGDSGLCCCVCVSSFERRLTPLFVDSVQKLWASFCFRLCIIIMLKCCCCFCLSFITVAGSLGQLLFFELSSTLLNILPNTGRQNNIAKRAQPKADENTETEDKYPTSHFTSFSCCFVTWKKRLTPKIRMLCFVIINITLLNLLCVWISRTMCMIFLGLLAGGRRLFVNSLSVVCILCLDWPLGWRPQLHASMHDEG